MTTQLIYVYGTNGTGKTTLARALLAAAGGKLTEVAFEGKARATVTAQGLHLAGRYGNACGGIDGIQPYADAVRMIQDLAVRRHSVFAEGLVQPGWRTCVQMARSFGSADFILLDIPEEVCVKNVLKRRKAAGNDKPYDPGNLYRKARSARSWAGLVERAGLTVHRLNWQQAHRLCLTKFGLPADASDLY